MKTLGKILFLCCLSFFAGCASVGNYCRDRCNDAADIVTLSVGLGAGAKVRVGPLHAGLLVNHDVGGLRAGEFWFVGPETAGEGIRALLDFDGPILPSFGGAARDLDRIYWGLENMGLGEHRQKAYGAGGRFPFWYDILNYPSPPRFAPFYSQIEVVAGLLGTARIGFNPVEMLDFFLGFFGIDIMNDDSHNKMERLLLRFRSIKCPNCQESFGEKTLSQGIWYRTYETEYGEDHRPINYEVTCSSCGKRYEIEYNSLGPKHGPEFNVLLLPTLPRFRELPDLPISRPGNGVSPAGPKDSSVGK